MNIHSQLNKLGDHSACWSFYQECCQPTVATSVWLSELPVEDSSASQAYFLVRCSQIRHTTGVEHAFVQFISLALPKRTVISLSTLLQNSVRNMNKKGLYSLLLTSDIELKYSVQQLKLLVKTGKKESPEGGSTQLPECLTIFLWLCRRPYGGDNIFHWTPKSGVTSHFYSLQY